MKNYKTCFSRLIIAFITLFVLSSACLAESIRITRVEHNKTVNGQKSMVIHFRISAPGLRGRNPQVNLFFDSPKYQGLQDKNGKCCTANGKVAIAQRLPASGSQTEWADFTMTMPNSEIHPLSGNRTYYMRAFLNASSQDYAVSDFWAFGMNSTSLNTSSAISGSSNSSTTSSSKSSSKSTTNPSKKYSNSKLYSSNSSSTRKTTYSNSSSRKSSIAKPISSSRNNYVTCTKCKGTGICTFCKGAGIWTVRMNIGPDITMRCPTCQGKPQCDICRGSGKTTKQKAANYEAFCRAAVQSGILNYTPSSNSSSKSSSSSSSRTSSPASSCHKCHGSGVDPNPVDIGNDHFTGYQSWAYHFHPGGTGCPYCKTTTKHWHQKCGICNIPRY